MTYYAVKPSFRAQVHKTVENSLILRNSPGVLQTNGQARVIQFWYKETLQIAPEGGYSMLIAREIFSISLG